MNVTAQRNRQETFTLQVDTSTIMGLKAKPNLQTTTSQVDAANTMRVTSQRNLKDTTTLHVDKTSIMGLTSQQNFKLLLHHK